MSAASDVADTWSSPIATGGQWEHQFTSLTQVKTFNGDGNFSHITPIDGTVSGLTFGQFAASDVGKPFDVKISLETWIVGSNFLTYDDGGSGVIVCSDSADASSATDMLALVSHFHSNYPTNNLNYVELVGGGTLTPTPEPSSVLLLVFGLLAIVPLVRKRKRG